MRNLDELVAALRDDANIMRAQSGTTVRLNYDYAADAIERLRKQLEAARNASI